MTDTVELVQVYPVSQSVVEELLLSLGRGGMWMAEVAQRAGAQVPGFYAMQANRSSIKRTGEATKNGQGIKERKREALQNGQEQAQKGEIRAQKPKPERDRPR